ncbi:MAG: copper transport protein [Chloroflexota bacterium]|nr:copper transport protein [Chloroflexota bacterium]
MRSPVSTIRGAAFSLTLAVIASVLAASPALAHASVTNGSPAAHSQLSGSPPYVDLRFSSRVVGAALVQVHDASGQAVRSGPTELLDGGLRMRARIPALRAGDYVVDWRALSQDGHLSLGRYGFSVGVGGQSVAAGQASVPVLEATVRWVYLMALLVAFGSLVTTVFTWTRLRRHDGRALPSLPVVALLEVAGAGALTQLALVAQRAGFDLTQAPVAIAALQALMVLAALALAMRAARPGVLLVSLGSTVVVTALGGHSAASAHWWAGAANAVHLLAVALWTGGLAQLTVAGWSLRSKADQPALLAGARQYARFALLSVVLAILTGLLSAAAEFGSVQQLTGSGYGRVLLVKVALIGFTLLLALGARLAGIPGRRAWRPRLLRRIVRFESIALAAVVAAAALLANTAPPQPASAATAPVPVPVLMGPVLDQAEFDGRYLVRLRVDSETVLVQLRDAAGNPPTGVQIDVFTVTPDYDDLNVFPRACGPGCAVGDYPWQPGNTAVLVVSRSGGRETTVAFSVRWQPLPTSPGALARVVDQLTQRPDVAIREQFTGPGGTSPRPDARMRGTDAVHQLGLDAPGLVALPYQSRPDTLLLAAPSGLSYELQLGDDGSLTHELLIGPGGRVERFLG